MKMSPEPVSTKDRFFLMVVLFVGYMVVVYVRESVSYSAPVIADAEHLTNSDLGLIVSSQKLGYTLIKVLGGTMVDVLDPGLIFSVSLALTGLSGMAFTAFSTVGMFSLTWFLSGMIQGPAWPAIAVLLRQSVPASMFSTCWSILSASANVASTTGPLMSQYVNGIYPWRHGFMLFGTVAIIVALVGGAFLMNFQGKKRATESGASRERKDSKSFSVSTLVNPVMLMVCLAYFLFSIVRGACNDWSQHYVIQDKEQSILTGGRFISSQEIGGFIGSIVAGYMSDRAVVEGQHHAMPRLKTQCLFSVLLTLGLSCLIFLVNPLSSQMCIHTVSFFLGFGLYGCITLVGVLCMDVAPSHLAGTSLSFGTLAANVGRVVAGYPLTMVASYYSWHEGFLTTLCVSVLSVVVSLVLMPMVNNAHQAESKKKQL